MESRKIFARKTFANRPFQKFYEIKFRKKVQKFAKFAKVCLAKVSTIKVVGVNNAMVINKKISKI